MGANHRHGGRLWRCRQRLHDTRGHGGRLGVLLVRNWAKTVGLRHRPLSNVHAPMSYKGMPLHIWHAVPNISCQALISRLRQHMCTQFPARENRVRERVCVCVCTRMPQLTCISLAELCHRPATRWLRRRRRRPCRYRQPSCRVALGCPTGAEPHRRRARHLHQLHELLPLGLGGGIRDVECFVGSHGGYLHGRPTVRGEHTFHLLVLGHVAQYGVS